MLASVVKNPTMIMVTLLCGRVLSEWALRLLLIFVVPSLTWSAINRVLRDASLGESEDIFGEKGLCPPCLDFPDAVRAARKRGKGRQQVKKPFSIKGGQAPLQTPSVTH